MQLMRLKLVFPHYYLGVFLLQDESLFESCVYKQINK